MTQPSGARIWCSKCGNVKPKLGSKAEKRKGGSGNNVGRVCFDCQKRGK